MKKFVDIFIDGACRGNPGPAAVGVIIMDGEKAVKKISQPIGEATNNIAEYAALIFALQEALILRMPSVKINTDSELLFNQFKGRYKIKNANLKFLYSLVQHLLTGFESVDIRQIPREKNKEADALAAKAIKKEQAKMIAPMFDMGEESPSSEG